MSWDLYVRPADDAQFWWVCYCINAGTLTETAAGVARDNPAACVVCVSAEANRRAWVFQMASKDDARNWTELERGDARELFSRCGVVGGNVEAVVGQ